MAIENNYEKLLLKLVLENSSPRNFRKINHSCPFRLFPFFFFEMMSRLPLCHPILFFSRYRREKRKILFTVGGVPLHWINKSLMHFLCEYLIDFSPRAVTFRFSTAFIMAALHVPHFHHEIYKNNFRNAKVSSCVFDSHETHSMLRFFVAVRLFCEYDINSINH